MTDRRSQIIDVAARLIAQRGFTQTSVEDVIKHAGLSGKSHFYHYFGSKEELGFAVLDRQFERFAARGLAVLREPMIDPLDRLGLFIDSLVALQAARGCREGSPFGSLAAELADAHEGFRTRLVAVFARWSGQMESLLSEARPQLTHDADAARIARFVIAAMEGALLMSRVDRDVAALRQIAVDLKRFVAMHVRDAETARRLVQPPPASAAPGTPVDEGTRPSAAV